MSLKDKLTKTFNKAEEKTNELASVAKTKLEITNKRSQINKLYKTLGEDIYKEFKNEQNYASLIDLKCQEISVIEEDIKSLENQL